MPRLSAGIMLYRHRHGAVETLLVHPGGPFWAKRDEASWSVPKGEYLEGEQPLDAAYREFREETGFDAPTEGLIDLGTVKYGRKIVQVWAVQGDLDAARVVSNTVMLQWPPRSGRMQEFPEVDQADWFTLDVAEGKLVKGQVVLAQRLREQLAAAGETA
jgi:predicted NUDIX family NTP pyrophosphohydrolase